MKKLIFGHQDSAIADLALRGFAGFAMAFGHGLGKMPPSDGFVKMLDGQGLPMAIVFAWLAGLSEFLGGILLGLGLATRGAAFFLFCTMAYAGFIHHGADPFSSKEKALLYAAISFFYAIKGAGKMSVDRMVFK